MIETPANPFTYIQFQFTHVFSVGVSLNNWNFFAAGLLDYGWVWSVDFLYIRLLAGVQEGVRVTADHYIDQWTIFGNLLVDKEARMPQCDDDIDAVLFQNLRLFTANMNRSNCINTSARYWLDTNYEILTWCQPLRLWIPNRWAAPPISSLASDNRLHRPCIPSRQTQQTSWGRACGTMDDRLNCSSSQRARENRLRSIVAINPRPPNPIRDYPATNG